jgi:hypothetical protein
MSAAQLALAYVNALKWPVATVVVAWCLIRTVGAVFLSHVSDEEETPLDL